MTAPFAMPTGIPGAPPRGATRSIRVMAVDDSLVARSVYARIIDAEADMALVAQASSAEQAIDLLRTTAVDVILLDLLMPGMGGLEALPRLMELAPDAKVLVVSSLTVEGGQHTVEALALGAADTLPKPVAGRFDADYRTRVVEAIRALAGHRLRIGRAEPLQTGMGQGAATIVRRLPRRSPRVLAIGASTGGILALRHFFERLPARIGIPILITQHLPPSFLPAFAEQVARSSGRPASLARSGALIKEDEILIAPGTAHLRVEQDGDRLHVRLGHERAPTGCLPSVDPMLASLAEAVGERCLAVVLTGMGRDGVQGARQLVEAGGSVLVQDEESSAVWGMPGAIANAGLAADILPPHELAARIPIVKVGG